MANFRKIRNAIIGCSLVASLLLVLIVPKEAHRHYGGRTNHYHTALPEVRLIAKQNVESKPNDLQNDQGGTSVPWFKDHQLPSWSNELQSELAHWRELDVSLDDVRDELVFGETEGRAMPLSHLASRVPDTPSASNLIPAHDESVPHVHFVLLGFEFTMNLPGNRQVADEDVPISVDPKLIQTVPTNVLAMENTVAKVEVLSGPTSVKVKLAFPHWLYSDTVLSNSNRLQFAFGQPQDRHAQSLDQQVDSPPPRLS